MEDSLGPLTKFGNQTRINEHEMGKRIKVFKESKSMGSDQIGPDLRSLKSVPWSFQNN